MLNVFATFFPHVAIHVSKTVFLLMIVFIHRHLSSYDVFHSICPYGLYNICASILQFIKRFLKNLWTIPSLRMFYCVLEYLNSRFVSLGDRNFIYLRSYIQALQVDNEWNNYEVPLHTNSTSTNNYKLQN